MSAKKAQINSSFAPSFVLLRIDSITLALNNGRTANQRKARSMRFLTNTQRPIAS